MKKEIFKWFFILNLILISCSLKTKEHWYYYNSENKECFELILDKDKVLLKALYPIEIEGIVSLENNEIVEGFYDRKNDLLIFDKKSLSMNVIFKSDNTMNVILDEGIIFSLISDKVHQ